MSSISVLELVITPEGVLGDLALFSSEVLVHLDEPWVVENLTIRLWPMVGMVLVIEVFVCVVHVLTVIDLEPFTLLVSDLEQIFLGESLVLLEVSAQQRTVVLSLAVHREQVGTQTAKTQERQDLPANSQATNLWDPCDHLH